MNRYDDRARLVFHYAREEGSRLGHTTIGPEHILPGIPREGDGVAWRILQGLSGDPETIRWRVQAHARPHDEGTAHDLLQGLSMENMRRRILDPAPPDEPS